MKLITVVEFLKMQAQSRLSENIEETVQKCLICANSLVGEAFSADTKVPLSGGQPRALMIADTAYMSSSPLVLIDEIENAGINRKQAIGMLSKNAERVTPVGPATPLTPFFLTLGLDNISGFLIKDREKALRIAAGTENAKLYSVGQKVSLKK